MRALTGVLLLSSMGIRALTSILCGRGARYAQ